MMNPTGTGQKGILFGQIDPNRSKSMPHKSVTLVPGQKYTALMAEINGLESFCKGSYSLYKGPFTFRTRPD